MTSYIDTFKIENFSFTYAAAENPALRDINLTVSYGEFITLCGKSGSGKSTFLRNLKTVLTPEGETDGAVEFYGRKIHDVSKEEQARRIGYVLQDPENQIVTDKVWHELAFGLENLGVDTNTIRIRVAEMASFFGISPWINKEVSQLSGGQKQLLNLAAVMTMNPDVLILDEPTSYLDPVASEEFIDTLVKINREIGTTVIISEHNLNQVMAASDRVIVMEEGTILADETPDQMGRSIMDLDEDFVLSLPIPLQVYGKIKSWTDTESTAPLTVREGRNYLTDLFKNKEITIDEINEDAYEPKDIGVKLKDIRFKYHKNDNDVIKNLNLKIEKASITTIVGGNGAGKSTLMRIIAKNLKPYRGKASVEEKNTVLLPQNPQVLFATESVEKEFLDVVDIWGSEDRLPEIYKLLDLEKLKKRHPYDLSGGEQQRLAIGKILLTDADIFLLDEPTTGLDGSNKKVLGDVLQNLTRQGKTVVLVSHDLEFAAEYSDICLLLFDGQIMSSGQPAPFFSGNRFYTTAANRMSRHIFRNAVTPDDIANLCKQNMEEQ